MVDALSNWLPAKPIHQNFTTDLNFLSQKVRSITSNPIVPNRFFGRLNFVHSELRIVE